MPYGKQLSCHTQTLCRPKQHPTTPPFTTIPGCYGPYCEVYPTSLGGLFDSPEAAHAYTHCKLSGLPDLNHTNPAVLSAMKDVFSHTMATYTPDGLRLDAAGHSDTVGV